jgi:hypothetical protein
VADDVHEDQWSSADEGTWSVALSGGGHRSAMFTLGAICALADLGELAHVRSVASVSGGSITNGVLALRHAMKATSAERVLEAAAPLVARCSTGGTVQWAPSIRRRVSAMAGLALTGALALGWASRRPLHRFSGAVAGTGLLATAFATWNGAAKNAEAVFAEQLYHQTRLDQLDDDVAHVFCITDLVAGNHLFLSQHFGDGTLTRRTDRPTVSLARAVQLSANFPAFPARRIRASSLGFQNSRHRWLVLTDGGVYDNLGDQWARTYWDRHRNHPDWRQNMGPVPERLLVVNGSRDAAHRKAPRLATWPGISSLWSLGRDVAISHTETTATRRHDLIAQFDLSRQMLESSKRSAVGAKGASTDVRPPMPGSIVHIGTPATWPLDPKHAQHPPGVSAEHFADVQRQLRDFPETDLLATAAAAANKTPVTLKGLGTEVVTDLIWHGHALSAVNLAVFFGMPLKLRTRSEIEPSVRRALRDGNLGYDRFDPSGISDS